MSDAEAEEDPIPQSPLTAGLEKRALMEMRAILTANTLRPFYSLLVTAGHHGIVSTIDSDSVNLEDIPAVYDHVSDVATRALKKLLKLLEDAGKTLEPPESVPGVNAEERCKQVQLGRPAWRCTVRIGVTSLRIQASSRRTHIVRT